MTGIDRSLIWSVSDHQDAAGDKFADRYSGLANDVSSASDKGVWQYFRTHRKFIGRMVEVEDESGRIWSGVNAASQDYLGLSGDLQVLDAAKSAMDAYGVHSSGSAPMGGGIFLARSVEAKIGAATGLKQICLFPTGWAAGYGIIYGIVRKRDHIVIDALAHNCLQHGASAATPNVHKFVHNDMSSLERRLKIIRRNKFNGSVLIVTESLFSMDSDSPHFHELIELKKKYDAHLMLDVAHDFGCLGPSGKGLLEATNSYTNVDYLIGSFSKTFASIGGFFATNCLPSKRAVQGFSGSYTFSNSLMPAQLGAINASLEIIFSSNGDYLRHMLISNTLKLRELLSAKGVAVIGVPSAMTIIVAGNEARARIKYKKLLELGVIVNCVEYPAVRRGEARFRIQLTPHHTRSELEMIADGIGSVMKEAK